jgi:hypothetical protein
MSALLADARAALLQQLTNTIWTVDTTGVPSNADGSSAASVAIAKAVRAQVCATSAATTKLAGQISGNQFELICGDYLRTTFLELKHLRPGAFKVQRKLKINMFEQYEYLALLADLAEQNPTVRAALNCDYIIAPDVVITRSPEPDSAINAPKEIVDPSVAALTPLRAANSSRDLLHASVSCKWTLRSDRAQNARSEALNLVRNRKGRVPHIVVITSEPMPSRIASLALGTGDVDCVYHVALPEMRSAISSLGYADASEMLDVMISGKRLKDISDLPLDLAI